MDDFEELGRDVGRLAERRNGAYGNSFNRAGKILSVLYPNGIRVEQYRDLLVVTRIIDNLFRIATDQNAFGENPFLDIAEFSLLGAVKEDRND
jgi:hypothetical protein